MHGRAMGILLGCNFFPRTGLVKRENRGTVQRKGALIRFGATFHSTQQKSAHEQLQNMVEDQWQDQLEILGRG